MLPPLSLGVSITCNVLNCRHGATADSAKFEVKKFTFLPKMIFEKHAEFVYLRLVQDIISNGTPKDNRTGAGTLSKFGCQKVFWRGVVEELLWFIRGSTNAKFLREKGIHIWDDNTSRDYLDSISLVNREEGNLGPVYGFQWRHFGSRFAFYFVFDRYTNMYADYTSQGFDQLLDVIDKIKNNPDDRRIILSAWNPTDLLTKFILFQICLSLNLVPGDFVHVIGDAHVYRTLVRPLEEQLQKLPKPFPVRSFLLTVADAHNCVAGQFAGVIHGKIGFSPRFTELSKMVSGTLEMTWVMQMKWMLKHLFKHMSISWTDHVFLLVECRPFQLAIVLLLLLC
ncbi:bifunctional dihydrofolate reductase-thymidylate synthase 1-like [Actinidia eriantha]|uniref:bifunctional dihydrofolate reductase-thymidylate synthase 1-like n=1 Tax=Actinidia eriantha TaxID=165200 RepID=UPI00258628E3|nr:bifunctional dihydrofolate reductase-thymidylate synthase 1-like [Actinidia eriantha]